LRYQLVPVKNVLMLHSALEALSQRSIGVPGLGLIYGRTGAGKSTALASMIARTGAAFVRAHSAITLSNLLDMICFELGVEGKLNRNSEKFRLICEALQACPRPIFVDEGDYLLHDIRMLEILRDIHDTEQVPVLLVGMAGIERKLVSRPQFARRISQRVEFQPCDLEDARLVTDALCEVEIQEDLLLLMHKKTQGCIGHMVVALAQFEAMAKGHRWTSLDAARWGERTMFLGSDRAVS